MNADMAKLQASLLPLGTAPGRGVLVATVGLPGSGKSHLARRLVKRLPTLLHMESDALRRVLFSHPRHGYKESRRLFRAIDGLIGNYLAKGRWVLLDATNLREEHRLELKRIADSRGCPLLLVAVKAPEKVIVGRLMGRPANTGEAGLAVYRRLRREAEPIQLPHHCVDTSRDISSAVEKIAGEIESL